MLYQLLAAGLIILHFGFVGFVVVGGVLCFKWQKIAWVHLPAVVWAIAIELTGKVCPLTPLENYFRLKSGESTYSDDFISHYLIPILYPEALTRKIQFLLGLTVFLINITIYGVLIRRTVSKKRNIHDL
ncbi:MAG: DUF2784 domain-containing protein [Deltaproteobacteria bacterium]|jgi:hypothetical protein|nr:DUF2784 domain-containing protein [Deltaproteobacteria bacterium]MBT4090271.1 DUF2784 domain-containing protein [Deltaproteobacteria bacterium]MBT4268036.1 DUF2784 domain-containing protein [Deltaproteobacteria bacterium]MBT4641496.1 DUF2784 domain-containing protein [Deltaproteobacteria bacterium]MBT6503558.1 DUF2784 domain-containing protein [Deltaproteobacteria bacterium]